jgi:hypothetical protein
MAFKSVPCKRVTALAAALIVLLPPDDHDDDQSDHLPLAILAPPAPLSACGYFQPLPRLAASLQSSQAAVSRQTAPHPSLARPLAPPYLLLRAPSCGSVCYDAQRVPTDFDLQLQNCDLQQLCPPSTCQRKPLIFFRRCSPISFSLLLYCTSPGSNQSKDARSTTWELCLWQHWWHSTSSTSATCLTYSHYS